MSSQSKIPVAVIGANGYTGVELVRLLAGHSQVELRFITSRQHEGQKFSQVFPSFTGSLPLSFSPLDMDLIASQVQAVFLCLPHHEAMNVARSFYDRGIVVFDLSADFRLKNSNTYEHWYGPHSQKDLLTKAVYGLPETHRHELKGARLIACPGCYPTSIQLALAPVLKTGLIDESVIICDSKSGVSGAGRGAKIDTLASEVHDNFKAYNLASHRHTPEIEQELSFLAGHPVSVVFSPHLLPIDRGILSTIYCKTINPIKLDDVFNLYQTFYQSEPFVKVLPLGVLPQTKSVRGTNLCHLGLAYDERLNYLILVSVIDNLTKGASGQAVQNFNLVFGLPEDLALPSLAFYP